MSELLTGDERKAIRLLGEVAGQFRVIIGDCELGAADWAEVVDKVHQLQAMVMSQAAARAYPDEYRLLGDGL